MSLDFFCFKSMLKVQIIPFPFLYLYRPPWMNLSAERKRITTCGSPSTSSRDGLCTMFTLDFGPVRNASCYVPIVTTESIGALSYQRVI
jgi:hypothetical protein